MGRREEEVNGHLLQDVERKKKLAVLGLPYIRGTCYVLQGP